MFNFIGNIRDELFDDFVHILDYISLESLSLYDKITDNLIVVLRTKFSKPRCGDKFLV